MPVSNDFAAARRAKLFPTVSASPVKAAPPVPTPQAPMATVVRRAAKTPGPQDIIPPDAGPAYTGPLVVASYLGGSLELVRDGENWQVFVDGARYSKNKHINFTEKNARTVVEGLLDEAAAAESEGLVVAPPPVKRTRAKRAAPEALTREEGTLETVAPEPAAAAPTPVVATRRRRRTDQPVVAKTPVTPDILDEEWVDALEVVAANTMTPPAQGDKTSAPTTEVSLRKPVLYFGAIPMHEAWTSLDAFIQELEDEVAKEFGVSYYGLIDFGKGPKAIASKALVAWFANPPVGNLYLSPSHPAGEEIAGLFSRFGNVVRGGIR